MDTIATQHDSPGWVAVLEGVILILFGLAAIAWPGMTIYAFTVIFGLYALITGIIRVIEGLIHIASGWVAIGSIAVGALLIVAGSYIFNHPGVSALTLVLFVGFTFIIKGIFEIISALSTDIPHKALPIIAGSLAIIAGLILLRYPVGGGVAYAWVLGVYALISGPIQIAVGLGAGPSNRRPTPA